MTAATGPSGRGFSRVVVFAGIALGTFLVITAYTSGFRWPAPGLAAFLAGVITWVLAVVLAVTVLEVLRRHHRAIGRHAVRYGKRGAVATARHAHRHGKTVHRWLVAKAAPRWDSREHRPLMFRKLRGEPEAPAPEAEDSRSTEQPAYSFGRADQPYAWPVNDLDEATATARHMSTGGNPYVVTEYPPGGGPGRTIATYVNGKASTEGANQHASITQPHQARAPGPAHRRPVRRPRARRVGAGRRGDRRLRARKRRRPAGLDDRAGQRHGRYAEALIDFYETCTTVIGIDPARLAVLHDVADAAAHAAETMAAAKTPVHRPLRAAPGVRRQRRPDDARRPLDHRRRHPEQPTPGTPGAGIRPRRRGPDPCQTEGDDRHGGERPCAFPGHPDDAPRTTRAAAGSAWTRLRALALHAPAERLPLPAVLLTWPVAWVLHASRVPGHVPGCAAAAAACCG